MTNVRLNLWERMQINRRDVDDVDAPRCFSLHQKQLAVLSDTRTCFSLGSVLIKTVSKSEFHSKKIFRSNILFFFVLFVCLFVLFLPSSKENAQFYALMNGQTLGVMMRKVALADN